MSPARKCLRSIKTMAGLTDRRRTRTATGALMEMSVLASEKERLRTETEQARRRQLDIETRLAEIAEKELRLLAFINAPEGAALPGTQASGWEAEDVGPLTTKKIRY